MSSEEMRIELERFVNKGLQEGWTGWPLKMEAGETQGFDGAWSVVLARGWFDGYDRSIRPARLEDTFAMLHSLC